MLERLELQDVGPAPSMRLDLAPRLNMFAGDNGVGKTLVLDIAWWALTDTWIGSPAAPRRRPGAEPSLKYAFRPRTDRFEIDWKFDFAEQTWDATYPSEAAGEKPIPVFYARADGSFSIWDKVRVAGKLRFRFNQEAWGLSSAFHFSPEQVWRGLAVDDADGTVVCSGLIRDWATWQLQRGLAFDTLSRVLEGLSPHPGETIRPGASTTRISIHDVRDIPTIDLPYGTIPVVHASAGMKRILGLAYLLVWMWREHVEAAKLKNMPPSKSLIVLFDEIEAHLHPQWQRVLLPSLLRVVRELSPEIDLQILATTHAPLVLASIEPHFDEARDALFHFDLNGAEVTVSKVPWRPRGDASAWLKSDVFELGEDRSVEAEQAIFKAKAAMLQPDLSIDEVRRIHHELHAILKDTDPFWPRWLLRARQAGVEP
jgi:AAA domain, putative AbiEii toxin, Type IV TA system